MRPLDVHEATLPNGLKILVVEEGSAPIVTHQLWVRVGSRSERSGLGGLSHLVEHLMFRGTARFEDGAYDRIAQQNGMVHNAWTGTDATVFYLNCARDRLPVAMELEADRLGGLSFDDEVFRRELAVVREERRQSVDDPPFGLLAEAVDATVFHRHPYRRPVIGWDDELAGLTANDARRHLEEFYRPGNAVLVVVGDVRAAEVIDLAARHYGPLPAGPAPEPPRVREPEQQGERTVRVHRPVELPGLLIAWRAPAAAEPDAAALNVIEFLLLHGRSSRAYQRLVYQAELVTGYGGGFALRADPSVFTLRATARPGVMVERLLDAIDRMVDSLIQGPVAEGELARIRRVLEADYIFSRESRFEIGQNLGEDECRTGWREYPRWLDRQLAVTPEEILAVARRVFDPRKRTIGYLVPDRPATEAGAGESRGAGAGPARGGERG